MAAIDAAGWSAGLIAGMQGPGPVVSRPAAWFLGSQATRGGRHIYLAVLQTVGTPPACTTCAATW